MDVDPETSEKLRTNDHVVDVILGTQATDEIIPEAYSDIVNVCQSCARTKKYYF